MSEAKVRTTKRLVYFNGELDEALFTCTPFCMVPALWFEGRPIGSGRVGPVYAQLIERWGRNVGVDIIGQIQAWASQAASESQSIGTTPYKFGTAAPKASAG